MPDPPLQTPAAPRRDDRRPDACAAPLLAAAATGRPGGIGKAVDPGRTAGLEDERADVLPPKAPPASNGNVVACPAPDGDDGRPVGLVAAQARVFDRHQPAGLLGDGREHLPGRHPTRHQRRDPAQRRLLLGQHTQLLTAQRSSPSPRDRALHAKAPQPTPTPTSATRRPVVCGRSAGTSRVPRSRSAKAAYCSSPATASRSIAAAHSPNTPPTTP